MPVIVTLENGTPIINVTIVGSGPAGRDGIDGQDGAPGQDGYTPVKGVDYFDGQDGAPGQNGADGYTPVKGVDYFDGQDGADGRDGTVSWHTSVAPVFLSPWTWIFTIADLEGPAEETPKPYDFIFYDTNYYIIYPTEPFSDTYVYCKGFTSIKGDPGQDGTDGDDGTTFTPAVSAAGVISWTNDGGKQNPASVDLVAAVISALPTWQGGNY